MEDLICKFYGILQQEALDLPPIHSWSPHKCYTPSSLHLTFPLVTRVNLRRPSDFRLTFANIVAVIHEKNLVVISSSCSCSSFSADFKSGTNKSLRDVSRWHGSRSHEEADIKIEEILRKIIL